MKKIQDYVIEVKEEFLLKKRKLYLLSRKEREKIYKFIKEQLRKAYIMSFQTALVFFIGKENSKKYIV